MEPLTTPFSRQTQSGARRAAGTHPARSDAAIEEAVWQAICADRALGARSAENIRVTVEQGQVGLRGHVTKAWHIPLIVHLAGRVEGARGVQPSLVADERLRARVLQALARDERTAPYVLTARCSYGWVQLGGLVPAEEIARSAEAVAGSVADVRGVLALPSVFGALWLAPGAPEEAEFAPRRALQPEPAAAVYQDGGVGQDQPALAGLVSQVILDPCSRLVSALAVRPAGGGAEWLVPIAAVEAASARQVWLRAGTALDACPIFERARCPLPPAGWQPPFPYLPGEVRWSL